MGRRQRLLAQARARLELFSVGHDPAIALDPEALAELVALLEMVPDPAADPEIAHAAGWLHWCRYLVLEAGDDQDDLAAALALFAPVWRMHPDAVPDQVRAYFGRLAASDDPQAMADRATTLLRETLRTGDQTALNTAIGLLQQAVAAIPDDHPDRAAYLSNFGLALRSRFDRTGNLPDLDAAITAGQQAVADTPDDHPDRAGRLTNLCGALRSRFERAGDLADLDAAITAGQQAVTTTPDDHPDRAGRLTNLCGALQRRFERTGNLADLDAAITAGRQAVATSPDDHPDRAMYLSNLGLALRIRFERTGNLADLDAAITAGQQAVAATPGDHPDRAGRLSNLCGALQRRFDRTGDLADLDAAITAGRQAVATSPDDHPDRAIYLSNLGSALRSRSDRTGNLADLDAAIIIGQRAVATSPDDHPGRAMYLSNLGSALRSRFERTGNLADLDAAITVGQQAAAATPDDHPDRAMYLYNLGSARGSRFDRTGNLADLDAAITVGQQAVAIEAAPPRVQVLAARAWGHVAAGGGRWQEAVGGFAAAAELLGLVAPRSLPRGDQEHLLGELGGLGADAAACCVRAGLTNRAVELFEQGRGVLLGQALDTRTDLTVLTEQHPRLAARFTALRDDLDQAATPPALMPADVDWAATERRAAATAFDQVIAEIRDLPGFAGFLRPPPVAELLAATAQGPVVIVTVSRFGSYALIMTADGVLDPVPLAGLTPQAVYDQLADFLAALDEPWTPAVTPGGRAAARQPLSDTLGWLWDELASPVLHRLAITSPPQDGQPWPRLWWCLSGPLSLLPVHAAGHHHTHASANPATVIDRVISSYTPTIRALAHARRPRPAATSDADDQPGNLVVVAMPRTPGAPDLPGAEAETERLKQLFPGQVSVLTAGQATRATVLAALPAARRAHFACHGTSDPDNPSASRLLLTDHEQRPLTVTDVARLRLDDADLAYLSACSTARPAGRLADEAIHLASAFQLAGYRHVIATMWPIGDQPAVRIADRIYATLTTTEGSDAADAVHATTRLMRRRWGPGAPSAWASHIHTGA